MAFVPTPPTLPDVSAATFDPDQPIDNPYSPFAVGDLHSYVAREEDSDEIDERNDVFVTSETRMIQGVKATVVRDTGYDDEGRRVEDTLDWHAQDTDGNVWYLGEISYSFEYDEDTGDFLGTSLEGSWEWGVDGALPGWTRPAVSTIGDSYYQEFFQGEAEDAAQVVATDEEVELDVGEFSGVIKTFDFSTAELTAREFKYAAPGIGVILEEGLDEDDEVEEINELVGIRSVVPGAEEAEDVLLSKLKEGKEIAPDESEREDFEEDDGGGSEDFTVTFLGGVDDLDNAVGVYEYDRVTGEIGEGRILFASSDETENGSYVTVEVAAGHALGVFLVSNAGEAGVELEDFEDGGLFFRNIASDGPATLFDGLEPLATDADGNLLPLTVFHALDGADDGINLLNAGGGVQASELELCADDNTRADKDDGKQRDGNAHLKDDGVLLGFEERMATDPEVDGDYNDVVLAISDDPLSQGAIAKLSRMFGSEVFEIGTHRADVLRGGGFDDVLRGGGGDDFLFGGGGDDEMHGAPGDDTIVGGWGDDLIVGGRGDDRIFGGGGDDTAHFRGSSAGYAIEMIGTCVVVTDIDASNGDVGTDTLANVEALRFADEFVLT